MKTVAPDDLDKLILHHAFGVANGHAAIAQSFSRDKSAAMDLVSRLQNAFPKETYSKFMSELHCYVAKKHTPGATTPEPWNDCSPTEICIAALKALGVSV